MKTDPPEKILCPFCGNKFRPDENECGGRCGFMGNCGLICCPRCRYSFVEESRTVRFFKKVVSWNRGKETKP